MKRLTIIEFLLAAAMVFSSLFGIVLALLLQALGISALDVLKQDWVSYYFPASVGIGALLWYHSSQPRQRSSKL